MIDYDGLNRLAYQIKTETGKAANTALRVGTLFEDIIRALAEGDNTDLISQITDLNNSISKIRNDIKDINTNIDQSILTKIAENASNISNIQNTIQNMDTTINGIQGDINTINGTLSNHTTLLGTIQGDISSIQNSIGAINVQLTEVNNRISSISSDLTSLTTRVSTNESDIIELRRQINNIDLSPITSAIDKLNVDLSLLLQRMSIAEEEINTLKDFTSSLSNQIAQEQDRAEAAEEALDAKFGKYLPLSAGMYEPLTGSLYSYGIYNRDKDVYLVADRSASNTTPKLIFGQINPLSPRSEISSDTVGSFIINANISAKGASKMYFGASNLYKRYYATSSSGTYTDAKIWSEDNDGSASGLDADLLDGHHWIEISTMLRDYLPLSGGTMTGNINFNGMDGGSMPVINAGANSGILGCIGMTREGANMKIPLRAEYSSNVYLGFSSGQVLELTPDIIRRITPDNKMYRIWDEGNDGSGSGLDADLLDGHHWTDFALKGDVPEVDLSGYLPLTGGTVTWLTVTNGINAGGVSSRTSVSCKEFNNDSTADEANLMVHNSSPCFLYMKSEGYILGKSNLPVLLESNTDLFHVKVTGQTSAINERYKILDESNAVHVVSSYPTDLSSYPDGAIFIKTS